MNLAVGVVDVGVKKTDLDPKRHGSLIRVSEAFAEAIRDVVGLEKTSAAKFADTHLLPIVQKRYRDIILKKARKMESSEE